MNVVRRKEILALLLGDFAVFFVALYLTLTVRFGTLPSQEVLLIHLIPFFVLFLVSLLISFIAGLYEKHTLVFKGKLPATLTRVQVINAVVGIAFFYFIPYLNITPKIVLFIYLVISLVLMVAWRMALAETLGLRRRTKALLFSRKNPDTERLYHEINNNQRYGTFFMEWIDPSSSTLPSTEIMEHVRSKKVTLIVADFTDPKVNDLMPTLYGLIFSGVQFGDIQKLYEEVFDQVPLSLVNDTWFIENVSSSTKSSFDIFKRLIDITTSVIGGVISLIFYPFICSAIKLDDGGVIFSYQDRVGQNNKIIRIVKFRTMTVANDGGQWTTGENKVTRVGSFLRKSRLDELPQFFNVFRGDLSLVGPRPEFPSAVESYNSSVPYYNIRHIIKPGLFGWAQIQHQKHPHHGLDVEETKNKLSYDLYYVKNRSVFLEMKIIVQTIKILLSFVGR